MPGGRRASRGGRKRGGRAPRRRTPRPQEPFYIHHTDNDMVLIIPNRGDLDLAPRRIRRPASPDETPQTRGAAVDAGWGETMPLEILHRVFQLLADSEGAVPTLCRLSLVCRRWCQVASSPSLWRRVSLAFCWADPGKKHPPKTQAKVRETVEKLAQERLGCMSEFSLHHWKMQVPLVVKMLSLYCPHLSSLTLSNCHGVTADALLSVAQSCPHLRSLNLQNSQVESPAVVRLLDECGPRLQRLFLTYSNQLKAIVSRLASGCCPDLRLLELNTEMKQGASDLPLCVESLQAGCPKLEVLRLLNLVWSTRAVSRGHAENPGFTELQELCLATSSYSFVSDAVCGRLLKHSTKLRVLDLRGCYKISPEGLCDLPCTDLERLYLGIYCSVNVILPASGCALLARRWQHSLQELDLTAQSFGEEDLAEALAVLSREGHNDTLQSLKLAGTKVTSPAIRGLLRSCRALTHLDLTSCRYLPRGMKRVYRGGDDIRQCLEGLSAGAAEEP